MVPFSKANLGRSKPQEGKVTKSLGENKVQLCFKVNLVDLQVKLSARNVLNLKTKALTPSLHKKVRELCASSFVTSLKLL